MVLRRLNYWKTKAVVTCVTSLLAKEYEALWREYRVFNGRGFAKVCRIIIGGGRTRLLHGSRVKFDTEGSKDVLDKVTTVVQAHACTQ
jgi:hypothetical protein